MDWPRIVFLVIEWLWLLLGIACLVAAAGVASGRPPVKALQAWLDHEKRAPRAHRASMLIWGAALPALLTLFTLAQYYANHLMAGSALMANIVWNTAHGHGMRTGLFADKSYLTDHFAFTFVLLAPVVRVWESITPLILAHGIAVGSTAWGVYLLAARVGKNPLIGWLMALLLAANPLFHNVTISYLDNVNFAPPLFIWAAYCWETGRRRASLLLAALLLTTREQVPFLFFGLGVFALLRAGDKKGRAAALGLMAGCVLLWLGEVAVIERVKAGHTELSNFWPLFKTLGGTPEGILNNAVHKPWLFPLALVYPPVKLWTVARTLLCLGLLPLASGPFILPALAVWTPQQLAEAGTSYHTLDEHYAALVLGPLVWSAAHGFARLYNEKCRAYRGLIVSGVLATAGSCFLLSGDFLPPSSFFPRSWQKNIPKAMTHIPRDAKLWCDEYLTPRFAMRRHIKHLPFRPHPYFETALFVPDRVVLSRHWIARADPEYLDRIFRVLNQRGFVRVFEEDDLIVLANPKSLDGSMIPVEWIELR